MEEFYRAFIGPRNQEKYVQHFLRFDALGKAGPTWHWPAFFVAFYWLLYRKMWLYALIYFVAPYLYLIVLAVVAAIAGDAGQPVALIGWVAYLAIIFIAMPMYANALYYVHCKKKIAALRSQSQSVERQLGELTGSGGTSNAILIVVVILGFFFFVGIIAAVSIPAYQDYLTRARVTEGIAIGNRATESVAGFFNKSQQVPGTLAEAGFSETLPVTVKAVAVDAKNGVVSVTMASPTVVAGKAVMFVPSIGADKQITWTCMSTEIANRYLPQKCRSSQK
jgi:hypothetical protein